MWIFNRGGRLVEVKNQYQAEKMIRMYGARAATDEELAKHLAEQKALAAEYDKPQPNTIYYQTVRSGHDGYGQSRDNLQRAMAKQGYTLLEEDIGQKIGLLYNYPYSITQMSNDVRVIYTMFESDKIPAEWPELLKQADEVLVPSQWCKEVFAESGVEATVVPLGYDQDIFKYVDRPVPVEENKNFTFIHYNGFNMRKGFFEVIDAFQKEFKAHEPVQMIIKTTHNRPPFPLLPSQYPNIKVIQGAVTAEELAALLERANCMVYPSRGEGFGLTPLEAMATGIPAIVPNAHGISHYFDPDYMLEVKIDRWEGALYQRFKGQDVGRMPICSVDDLRAQMRYAFNHQKQMKELGKKASEYAKGFTIEKSAEALMRVINRWQDTPANKRPEAKKLFVERF